MRETLKTHEKRKENCQKNLVSLNASAAGAAFTTRQRALRPVWTRPRCVFSGDGDVTADLKRLAAALAGQKRAHVRRLASCLD